MENTDLAEDVIRRIWADAPGLFILATAAHTHTDLCSRLMERFIFGAIEPFIETFIGSGAKLLSKYLLL